MKRQRVFVQVLDQVSNRWKNYKSFAILEEAEEYMRDMQTKYPKAIYRILNNNLLSHTY